MLLGVTGFLQRGQEVFAPLLQLLGPTWKDRRTTLPGHRGHWDELVRTDPTRWMPQIAAELQSACLDNGRRLDAALVLYSMGNVAATQALLDHPELDAVLCVAPPFRLRWYLDWPLRLVLFLYEYLFVFLFWLRWVPIPAVGGPCYCAGDDSPTFRSIPLIVAARLVRLQAQARAEWQRRGADWRRRFQGRALVIQGAADLVVDPQSATWLLQQLGPRAELVTVPGAGHDVLRDAWTPLRPQLARLFSPGAHTPDTPPR
jgi:pimeloyl-ACP methyl ester carboxylesterase